MIDRILIKDYLSFKNVDIELNSGLIAFSGASGAGKSVFMSALLGIFGLKDADAKVIEASLDLSLPRLEEFGIENEDINVLRFAKEKKARYFINSQALSRKNMGEICKDFVRHLSVASEGEFSSKSILDLLDEMIGKKDKLHVENLQEFKGYYEKFLSVCKKLKEIEDEEKRVDELREFAKYEIKIIDEIDPKIGEDEELRELKKSLSKKEKILNAIEKANGIFEFEYAVTQMLDLCEKDSSFFDECMNELRAFVEDEALRVQELDDVDIEQMLERIEQISKLKSRFGEIEDVLKYKDKKLQELEHYENITFEKNALEEEFKTLQKKVNFLVLQISKKRQESLHVMEKMINDYLKKLYLKDCEILHVKADLSKDGVDSFELRLNKTNIKQISSGELNRIRLAFIAVKNDIQSKENRGILLLDEVDANLSGKESMSVALVLKQISKSYQVLVISHQPQLPSLADEHFLVEKKDDASSIKKLDKKQRVNELARMISGEKINAEALEFAKKLLQNT